VEIEPKEVFADELDRAAHISEMASANAVQEIRLAAQPEQVKVLGKWPIKECVSCGDDIVPERLEHGFIRCVICKEILERKQRGLG